MGLTNPYENPATTPAEPLEEGPRRAPAPEPAPAPARGAVEPGSGEIVPFPGAEAAEVTERNPDEAPTRTRAAVSVWFTEAGNTARAAVDGSVWRARPPALRDIHARITRAEWAGDIPALRIAGQAFGYAALVMTAAGYGLLWVLSRPLRLAVAVMAV